MPQSSKILLEQFSSKFKIASFEIVQGVFSGATDHLDHILYKPTHRIDPDAYPLLPDVLAIARRIMHENEGIGIAANQLGLGLQFFIIEAQKQQNNNRYSLDSSVEYQAFVNPRIVSASKSFSNFWHGCLSAKGQPRGRLSTYTWIEYEAQDTYAKTITGRLDGLAAIIFQHEFRHLLGGLYLNYCSKLLSTDQLSEAIKSGLEQNLNNNVPIEHISNLLADYDVGDSIDAYLSKRHKCY